MDTKKETTFHRFLFGIRGFISKLKNSPIKADTNKYLKDRGFDKDKTINILIKRGIVSRHESIKDSSNSDEKEAKYYVRYKLLTDGFEDKVHKIYTDYFGKADLNECEGGDGGGAGAFSAPADFGSNAGVSSTQTVGDYGVIQPMNKKKNGLIHGKFARISENRNRKKVVVSESQFNEIQSIMNTRNLGDEILNEVDTGSVGNYEYDTPGITFKKPDGSIDYEAYGGRKRFEKRK